MENNNWKEIAISLAKGIYSFAHSNKSAGYNGDDRKPEAGSIYEKALAILPKGYPYSAPQVEEPKETANKGLEERYRLIILDSLTHNVGVVKQLSEVAKACAAIAQEEIEKQSKYFVGWIVTSEWESIGEKWYEAKDLKCNNPQTIDELFTIYHASINK